MAKKIKLVPKTIPSPISEEDAMAILESLQEEIKIKFDKNGIEIPYDQLEVHINESKGSTNQNKAELL